MDNNFNDTNQSYEYENTAVPTSNPVAPKKKVPYGLIFGIGGGLLALILVVTGIFVIKFLSSPKVVVARALTKTVESATNPVSEHLGLSELKENTYKEPCSLSLSLSVDKDKEEDSLYDLEGAGFNIDAATDCENKEASADIALQWGGTDVLDCQYYAFDDTIGFACSELFDGYISVNAKTFGEDYCNSIFYDPDYSTFDEDDSIELFPDERLNFSVESYKELFPEDYASLIKNITVTKNETAAKSDSDEYDKNNTYYDVTIPRKDTKNLIDNISECYKTQGNTSAVDSLEELKGMLQEDLIILVAIDNTGRICDLYNTCNLAGTEDDLKVVTGISLNGDEDIFSSCEINMGFLGESGFEDGLCIKREAKEKGSTYTDEINISYLMDMETPFLDATYSSSYDFDEDAMDFSFEYKDMDENPIFLDGTVEFTNIEKGKSLSADFTDLTFQDDAEYIDLSLSGNFDISSENVKVKSPSGKALKVLDYDEDELNSLSDEVYENLLNSSLMDAFY